MKIFLILCLTVGLALAGRGNGGRRKTWYGPVTSEAECAASTRSPSVTFMTEDIATSVCKDVSTVIAT